MNQHKGFSLIEVLLSLMLVTALALALLEQQEHTTVFFKQLLVRVESFKRRDQNNEMAYVSPIGAVNEPSIRD